MNAQIEDRKATVDHLQAVWEALAMDDPLWAILSSPDKKERGWKLDEFLKTGEDEVQQLMTTLAVNDIPFVSEAVLDFGCGVGRVCQALARRFDVVYGVDISPQMIKTAVQLNQYGEKCRYFLNAEENLRIFHDGTFTFIYSNIVLQHIPPILTSGYLQEFLRVLRPGGLLIFQLPSSLYESGLQSSIGSVERRDYIAVGRDRDAARQPDCRPLSSDQSERDSLGA